jgi:NAD(P)-dependent dehydrogenase (short-subunit alcohol dehydrogenase family)
MTRRGWTADDIPDLADRVAIVTGSTSGIGLETACALAHRRAHVIFAVRNETKARKVLGELREAHPEVSVESRHLDLSRLGSISDFVAWFLDSDRPLDLLINNAGIMMVPYGLTVDGNELQFGTNHLGHFALTGRLLPALEAASAARVVTVSSLAHKAGDLDLDQLQFEGGGRYSPMRSYRRSKLANLVFALELDRRLDAARSSTISVAAHPGVSSTSLLDHVTDRFLPRAAARPVIGALLQDAEAGALPSLRAATDPNVRGGQYYGPAARGETSGPPVLVRPSSRALDLGAATSLWEMSQVSTSVEFL